MHDRNALTPIFRGRRLDNPLDAERPPCPADIQTGELCVSRQRRRHVCRPSNNLFACASCERHEAIVTGRKKESLFSSSFDSFEEHLFRTSRLVHIYLGKGGWGVNALGCRSTWTAEYVVCGPKR